MNIERIDYISKRPWLRFFIILTRVSFYVVRGEEMRGPTATIKVKP